jgi:hypothetical protein
MADADQVVIRTIVVGLACPCAVGKGHVGCRRHLVRQTWPRANRKGVRQNGAHRSFGLRYRRNPARWALAAAGAGDCAAPVHPVLCRLRASSGAVGHMGCCRSARPRIWRIRHRMVPQAPCKFAFPKAARFKMTSGTTQLLPEEGKVIMIMSGCKPICSAHDRVTEPAGQSRRGRSSRDLAAGQRPKKPPLPALSVGPGAAAPVVSAKATVRFCGFHPSGKAAPQPPPPAVVTVTTSPAASARPLTIV